MFRAGSEVGFSDMDPDQDILSQSAAALIIQADAYLLGDLLLKDGSRSDCFIDLGRVTGRRLYTLAELLLQRLEQLSLPVDVLVAPPYKAVPLAAVVSALSDIPFDFYRKEAKDHGEGGLWVTKALQAGHRALVVDDIYTSGTAKREAFQLIRAAGACPVGVLVVVNRTLETDSPVLDGVPIYWLTSLAMIRKRENLYAGS